MKNKWLAAFLNLIPGLGYLYVGTRTIFALLLLLPWPLFVMGTLIDSGWSGTDAPWRAMDWIMVAAAEAPFVVDAYMEAQRVGRKKRSKAISSS